MKTYSENPTEGLVGITHRMYSMRFPMSETRKPVCSPTFGFLCGYRCRLTPMLVLKVALRGG